MSDVMTHEVPPTASLRLPTEIVDRLACPRDGHAPLKPRGGALVCTNNECGLSFPIVDGLPVLIDESRSIFRTADFLVEQRTTLDLRDEATRMPSFASRLRAKLVGAVPSLSLATCDFTDSAALAEIEAAIPNPRILVIGAGDVRYSAKPGTTIVYSDVARGPNTHMIADAHDLPFADASFDAFMSIAVLQYLQGPARAMAEAHRVLKPDGYAYVVAPMIQQNTLGPYDFFLYTHAGLRRIMRHFAELRSGVANGPATALTWSIEFFMTSFSERRVIRSLLSNLTRFIVWPIKYFDRKLSRSRGAYDCASAF